MTVFNEQRHAFEFIVSQAAGHRSFTQGRVVVAAGATMEPGTLLGVAASGSYARVNPAATNGTQTVAAILCTTANETGDYTLLVRDAEVEAVSLTYSNDATALEIATQKDALESLGIVTRDAGKIIT